MPLGTVANVVGFPGLIVTRPKWTVPPKLRSMTGLRRSSADMLVPPVVRMMSTRSRPLVSAATWDSTLRRVG